jgi:hypothetical protein
MTLAEVRPMSDATRFVSVSTMARALGKPARTVRYWCERGWVRAVQSPGGVYSIYRSEIERVRRGEPLDTAAIAV